MPPLPSRFHAGDGRRAGTRHLLQITMALKAPKRLGSPREISFSHFAPFLYFSLLRRGISA